MSSQISSERKHLLAQQENAEKDKLTKSSNSNDHLEIRRGRFPHPNYIQSHDYIVQLIVDMGTTSPY